MFCTSRTTSPERRAVIGRHAARPTGWKVFASTIFRVAATLPTAAVLERTAVSMNCSDLPEIQGVDQHVVALADEAAPDLRRARQLAVVGVELLVQDQEAADLAAGELVVGREVGIDLLHAVADELAHLLLLRQVGVAAVGRLRFSAQLPTACMSMLMKAQTFSRRSPKATACLDVGKNLSLFSTYFGAKRAPSLAPPASRPTSLARSMIFRCPAASMKPASPVRYQPSALRTSCVASGFL
jgi:hypothetical protein